jgi:ABC-2 type transport system ATP-binding protein
VVTLQLAEDQSADGLDRFGQLVEIHEPKVRLRVARADVPRALAGILSHYSVQDVAVEDPPLEEVIAEVFLQVTRPDQAEAELAEVARTSNHG